MFPENVSMFPNPWSQSCNDEKVDWRLLKYWKLGPRLRPEMNDIKIHLKKKLMTDSSTLCLCVFVKWLDKDTKGHSLCTVAISRHAIKIWTDWHSSYPIAFMENLRTILRTLSGSEVTLIWNTVKHDKWALWWKGLSIISLSPLNVPTKKPSCRLQDLDYFRKLSRDRAVFCSSRCPSPILL